MARGMEEDPIFCALVRAIWCAERVEHLAVQDGAVGAVWGGWVVWADFMYLARKDVQSGPEVGVRVEGGACGVSMFPHGHPGGAGRGYCGWWGLKMDHDGPVPKGILG